MDRYGAFGFFSCGEILHSAILDSFDLFFAERKAMESWLLHSWWLLRWFFISASLERRQQSWVAHHQTNWVEAFCQNLFDSMILSSFIPCSACLSSGGARCQEDSNVFGHAAARAGAKASLSVTDVKKECDDVRWCEGKWHRTSTDRWCWLLIVKPRRCLWSLHNYDRHTCSCRFAESPSVIYLTIWVWGWFTWSFIPFPRSWHSITETRAKVVAATATGPSEGA